MKTRTIMFGALLVLFVFGACSSNPRIRRVDSDTVIDLSGRWNDTDARLVANSLISDCLSSPRINDFIVEYRVRNGGRLPAAVVGSFRNESNEHIDTSIIARAMEIAIVNSGRLDFVAGGDTLAELRAERFDNEFTSEETMAALANETGAILLLTGTINSMEDRAGNTTVRSYFVSAELTNIETRTRLWMGENS